MEETAEDVTPFTRELIHIGATVFSEVAPGSSEFTPAALLALLNDVTVLEAGIDKTHSTVLDTRERVLELKALVASIAGKVDRLAISEELPATHKVVAASRRATAEARVAGNPVSDWEASRLGVHASITVHDETSLVPYVPRAHDYELRQVLQDHARSGLSGLILVLGTSCTGKTRTLYEALQDQVPDWAMVAPGTDNALRLTLEVGVPARTVIWLDELQKRLLTTDAGIYIARAISALLDAIPGTSILFVGTTWPSNLSTLLSRPEPEDSARGADAIPDLLEKAHAIAVPMDFTDDELVSVPDDPRLERAIETAATQPGRGRALTQVLAGGTQLVRRLHPAAHGIPGAFSPAARAILLAAGDLRRIGMPNPLPGWALAGSAPAYLSVITYRPVTEWFAIGMAEVTSAAAEDDAVTGRHTLDIYSQGVPAMTPNEADTYDLHDYLAQNHEIRYAQVPPPGELWATLASNSEAISTSSAVTLCRAARSAGQLQAALTLIRPHALEGGWGAAGLFVELLIHQQGGEAEQELRSLVKKGYGWARQGLVDFWIAAGDQKSLSEVRKFAASGDRYALRCLIQSLLSRADEASLRELRDLTNRHPSAMKGLADFFAERNDDSSLNELRTLAESSEYAGARLVDLLLRRGGATSLLEVRLLTERHGYATRRLAEIFAERGDLTSLRELGDFAQAGSEYAEARICDVLMERADPSSLEELRCHADNGDLYAKRLVLEDLMVLEIEVEFQRMRTWSAAPRSAYDKT